MTHLTPKTITFTLTEKLSFVLARWSEIIQKQLKIGRFKVFHINESNPITSFIVSDVSFCTYTSAFTASFDLVDSTGQNFCGSLELSSLLMHTNDEYPTLGFKNKPFFHKSVCISQDALAYIAQCLRDDSERIRAMMIDAL